MLNQAAVDELYAATYVEEYLDCVENLPDDLQRHLSRIRELEISYHVHLREAEQQGDVLVRKGHDTNLHKRALLRATQALIAAQEIADEKLEEVQLIIDLLENKTRQLDLNYSNLDTVKEQEPKSEPSGKENQPAPQVSSNVVVPVAVAGGERQSKRQRRSRAETVSTIDQGGAQPHSVIELPQPCEPVTPLPRVSATATAAHSQKKGAATSSSKKKKRKAVRQQHREENPPLEEEVAIDPDEPTYCLCDQISYGEMILCDNDLCPIEWFHFSCVALATKPKGKWFCPKCRGDRPNLMKPKAQFLKELERYNKEKEEKG